MRDVCADIGGAFGSLNRSKETRKADFLAALTPLCGEIRDAEFGIRDAKLSINAIFAQMGQLKISESDHTENEELAAKITSAKEEVSTNALKEITSR
jgi:hypothetical protein